MPLISINPATGKVIKEYNEYSISECENLIAKANTGFANWRETSFAERANFLKNAANILRSDKERWGKLMTEEMGKPLREGIAEAEKCAWVCEYYADHGDSFLAPQIVSTEADKSFITFQPLGVILAIMPWNFPFWQAFRCMVPALMAGNTVVLKHASNVSGCALAIEEIILKAGFPDNVFYTLLIPSSEVGRLIEHPAIKAVSLTGSTEAGKQVAAKTAGLIKKTVLELGGSDPYLILEDADLESASEVCVNSRLINTGQSCIAAKRFIVVKSVANEFTNLMLEKMKKRTIGDPMDPNTIIGPMARNDLREQLHQQVKQSIKAGATCILGGDIPELPGAWYPPTILTNVKPGMPAFDEELFGPVVAIIEAEDEDHAILLANKTIFGLGAAVFTRNKKKGEEIAATRLAAGACFVNAFVRSDPRLPFGGIKSSGYGRELGVFGIREFVNIKTVYIS